MVPADGLFDLPSWEHDDLGGGMERQMGATRPTGGLHARRPRRLGVALAAATLVLVAVTAVIDRSGTASAAAGFAPLPSPRRLADTRAGAETFDGLHSGGGALAAGATYALDVAGRAGLGTDLGAVVLNVTAVQARDDGHVRVHPCDAPRPGTSNLNHPAGGTVAALTIVPVGADGRVCFYSSAGAHLVVDATGSFSPDAFTPVTPSARLFDSRPGSPTVDGLFSGRGVVRDGETVSFDVAGRAAIPATPGPTTFTLTAIGYATGYLTAWRCDRPQPPTSNLNYAAGQTVANTALVDIGADGRLCVFARGDADVVVDAFGRMDPTAITVLPDADRLVDSRAGATTADGTTAGIGLRPGRSTLQFPVSGRAGVPASAGAAVVNIVSTESRDIGYLTLHPPTPGTPLASNVNFRAGQTVANLAVVPLDTSGNVCLLSHARSHVIVDVVAYLPGTPVAASSAECPAQRLFPHWRMVAMYGNDSARVLGVLGEQDPDAAARRLDRVIAPWAALSDRPILPTFELIATVAQASAGSSGLYRARSSDEFVQRYLDAARRHGVYLLLDLQPGRSDFLTEAKAYEKFLREPDVGLALDPEWRTEYPNRPGGGYVGKVDASEVNAVADWLAQLVAAEGLPEKLLVVHQFQVRMITDKHLLREPEGIALTIHMDGFGTRSQKLDTYRWVHVDPPWNNGFKLFYDEDINMFQPADVLGGAVVPVPDLITYQ